MHVHSPLAYCSENMDVRKSMGLAEDFGLSGLTFAEHSGQLYFDKATYWSKSCLAGGIKSAQKRYERIEAYFTMLKKAKCRPCNRGLEVDCCYDGSLLALQKHIRKVKYLLGSIHSLAALQKPKPVMKEAEAEFLALTGKLTRSNIDILAHPFRVFTRKSMDAPQSLYDPVVKMLRKAGVAAEINFHTQTPDPEFYRRCLEAGVKLAFGSDAHNLYEIGEFTPHLALLKKCGIAGDPGDILFKPK
jgi:histidinol phosphatase-like PHP family hydrolase